MTATSRTLMRGTAAAAALLANFAQPAFAEAHHPVEHVLLISIDGMHAIDLQTFIAGHAGSALATLSRHGVTYPAAKTSAPSDSFPGLLAQVTGGTSKSHGVFYDVSYDRTLFDPGSACKGAPGTQPALAENLDKDQTSYTAGGTLGQPLTQIDASKLPLQLKNGKCVPVYPHDFIKTNTIFEVIHAAGGHTAWADKHPAYDIVNGPSGKGVDDLFTPEVNSNDSITGADTTTGFHSIQRNDLIKVQAILNEIKGLDSTGKTHVGVPRIFGMNFQAVSVGQKLATGNTKDPADAGLVGGYADAAGKQPKNGLAGNLEFVDAQLTAMLQAMNHADLMKNTLIIVSAKHGQSPINLADRKAVDDGPYAKTPGYAASITDDVGLVWLKPDLQHADYASAKAYLESQAATLGIVKLLDQDELAKRYQDPFSDNRTPDFIALTTHGLIYTGGTKLAEHGGFSHDDRNVALLVSHKSLKAQTSDGEVQTTQIAPTILTSLGLDPRKLDGVRNENTQVLPGLDGLQSSDE